MTSDSKNTVLIVDDEQNVYNALRRSLRGEDLNTVYAASGEEAEQILESMQVDVAIVDMHMPGMQGNQLLARIRQRWPSVVRMMLTGDTRLDVVIKAVNHGEVFRFFVKPANEAELIIALRDAFQLKALKSESKRLIETVKRQNETIKTLKPDDQGVIKLRQPEPGELDPSESMNGNRTSLGGGSSSSADPSDLGDIVNEIRQVLDDSPT